LNIRHFEGTTVKSTAKAVVHRLKQARTAIVRIEGALAGLQFLLALGPLGVLIGLALWARRRRTHGESQQVDTAPPPVADTETETPAEVATTSANAVTNGLTN
jgi:hypothetical protein